MSDATEGLSLLRTFSDELASAVERASRSVVAIHARRRIPSSGVHWTHGVIVTAQHTIDREGEIRVTLPDGGEATAILAGRDPGTDLAVLRIEGGAPFDAVARASDAQLRTGTLVLAIGRPSDAGVTASMGVISAVGPEFRTWYGGRIDRLVRLDIAVHDGFSGGTLVDAGGGVLGINTSGLSRRSALTVPATTVDRVVHQLLEKGRIARGYLGVGLQPVRLGEALRRASGQSSERAVLVTHVENGGPAERSGIMLGDIMVEFDGQPVSELRDIAVRLGAESVGRRLETRIIRGGAAMRVQVEVVERTADTP
ncbi:MAG: S1C family serine protease [Gemmatimonadetes bacterium]|nr:S1C family serine protease [Gemmatimonadota bacterium]